MKIYTDRQDVTDLSKYIGKDVWVYVRYADEDEHDYRWFRVLSKKPAITPGFECWYKVNSISCADDYKYVRNREQFDKDIQEVKTYHKGQFRVCEPLEVLTTDELYDNLVALANAEGWV